ncbi:MAG: hypothetical protein Kow0010_09540 [Dehalococcoidia bacterium]
MGHVRGLAAVVVAGIVALAFVMLAASACFGGDGDSGPGGSGRRALTNPASVPTATPGAGEVVFVIGPGGISAPTGDSTAGPATTPTASGTTYTVQSGDTCADIAARFGITFAELRTANPIIDEGCRNLRPDQVLRIPPAAPGGSAPATPEPGGGGGKTYVIESGDNCGSIAAAHGVTLEEFLVINELTEEDCTNLQVGDVVRIP